MTRHASGVVVGELLCCVGWQWVLGMCHTLLWVLGTCLTCRVSFGNSGEVVGVVVTRPMCGA